MGVFVKMGQGFIGDSSITMFKCVNNAPELLRLDGGKCAATPNREYKECNRDEKGAIACDNSCFALSDPDYQCA